LHVEALTTDHKAAAGDDSPGLYSLDFRTGHHTRISELQEFHNSITTGALRRLAVTMKF